MLTLEFIAKIISLDLQWFVELAMNNLVFLFMFLAFTFVFSEMKFSPKIFVVFTIAIIAFEEFLAEIGVFYLVGGFLFLYYVSTIALLAFTETIPALKGRI